MAEIRFDNVGKAFGTRKVFEGVSASFDAGDRVAVLGPNGSGKSTLLRIAAGLLRPSHGKVSINQNDGNAVSRDFHSRTIGYLAPYVQFYKDFTARENLEFLRALRADVPRQRIDDVLREVALLDRGGDLAGSYSSGMLQRLRLAAAILHKPEVLLLDEPVANLDEAGVALIETAITQTSENGGVVLIATNRMDVARRCGVSLNIADFA